MSTETRSRTSSKSADDHSYVSSVAKTGDKKTSMPCDDSNDCKKCCKEVKEADKALLCSRCKKWVHASCAGVSHNDYKCLN